MTRLINRYPCANVMRLRGGEGGNVDLYLYGAR